MVLGKMNELVHLDFIGFNPSMALPIGDLLNLPLSSPVLLFFWFVIASSSFIISCARFSPLVNLQPQTEQFVWY